MTKRRLTKQERLIRLELARTRAALERQNVARSLHDLHESLTPAGIWQSLFSRRGGGVLRSQMNWLSRAVNVSRRYPLLLTGASAVLGSIGRGRRGLAWRLLLGTLAGWKLLQRVQRQVPELDERRSRDIERVSARPSD